MKKKLFTLSLAVLLLLSSVFMAACSTDDGGGDVQAPDDGEVAERVTLTVGASTTPHAEILEAVKGGLAEQGIELVITEFQDYVLPNEALISGDLDANYFQHQPYLDEFNESNGYDIVGAAKIHYEPYAIYKGQKSDLSELEDGDTIGVPNDSTNEARALLLLEAEGLIKVREGAGITATVNDIEENPLNLKILELNAEMIPRSLPDMAFGVINGNNALLAELRISEDAVASEDPDSVGLSTYPNVLAVRNGDESRPEIQALIQALQSDEVKSFMEEKYSGAVIPVF